MDHFSYRSSSSSSSSNIRKKVLSKNQSKTCISIFFIVIISIIFSIKPNESSEVESCHLRELELCVIGAVSILQNPNGIPVTEIEIKRHCELMRESCECFNSYSDHCLTKLQASMVRFILKDVFQLEKDFCNNGTELRENYLKHANCLRDVQKKYQKTCLKDFQVGFEGIHKIDRTMRLPTACCNSNRLKDCVMPKIEDDCGENAFELVNGLLNRMIGSIFLVTCRNYDPMGDTCSELLSPIGTEPHIGRNTSAISRLLSSYMRM